jgi:hypothetical protein
MIRVFDGIVDGGGGEKAAPFALIGLIGEEEDGLVGVPILVKVPIFFIFEQEKFSIFLHRFSLFEIKHKNIFKTILLEKTTIVLLRIILQFFDKITSKPF